MNAVFFILVLVLFAGLTVLHIKQALRGDDLSILPQIENEFRTLVVDGTVPELSFDGRTAEIIDDRQEGIDHDAPGTFTLHRIHRFARNAHGEYFLFISEGSGKPFFKHVSQSNAKIALGSKYVASAPSNG
jgi:hypothetical protein